MINIEKDIIHPEYDIQDIANWLLLQSDTISHKKLQILCYYSVAWYWGINKEPLCTNGEFQAWVHGAVNPILYKKYKKYGWKYIPAPKKQSIITDTLILNFLKDMWGAFGRYSGEQLEALNHKEKPYKNARCNIDQFEPCTNVIEIKDMIQYYGDLFEKGQNL